MKNGLLATCATQTMILFPLLFIFSTNFSLKAIHRIYYHLQRLLRLRADDPLVLPGALPRHLHPALHLPPLRHQEGRHRQRPLLDHRPRRLSPPPRLHKDQLHRPSVSFRKLHLRVCLLCDAG